MFHSSMFFRSPSAWFAGLLPRRPCDVRADRAPCMVSAPLHIVWEQISHPLCMCDSAQTSTTRRHPVRLRFGAAAFPTQPRVAAPGPADATSPRPSAGQHGLRTASTSVFTLRTPHREGHIPAKLLSPQALAHLNDHNQVSKTLAAGHDRSSGPAISAHLTKSPPIR